VPSVEIFLNYRREDTAYPAGWLYDRLVDHFGRDHVFKDIDSIELGDDFVSIITTEIESCDVLLALIGEKWLTIADAIGHRRIDDPDDFVRLEIEVALERNIRVVPVLIGGAAMPRAHQLPASIAMLSRRNALQLSSIHFDADVSRLLKVLDKQFEDARGDRDVVSETGPDSPAADERSPHDSAATARNRMEAHLKRLGYWVSAWSENVYYARNDFPYKSPRVVFQRNRIRLEALNKQTGKYELVTSFSLIDEIDAALEMATYVKKRGVHKYRR